MEPEPVLFPFMTNIKMKYSHAWSQEGTTKPRPQCLAADRRFTPPTVHKFFISILLKKKNFCFVKKLKTKVVIVIQTVLL